MKKSVLFIALAFATFAITSCKKETVNPAPAADEKFELSYTNPGECTPTEVTLFAGQTINAGTVSVTNDGDFINVTYSTANGWVLTQTHLFVGECSLIPVNNPGNPMPGQFPYKTTHSGGITSYTYQVPVGAIGIGNCGCIAAHAVVAKINAAGQVTEQQTGWGNGPRINLSGGNWGMSFNYCTCTP